MICIGFERANYLTTWMSLINVLNWKSNRVIQMDAQKSGSKRLLLYENQMNEWNHAVKGGGEKVTNNNDFTSSCQTLCISFRSGGNELDIFKLLY